MIEPRPHVAIVIPVFGAVYFVRACVDTIRMHTQWPYTIHISDDCSPDLDLQEYMEGVAKEGVMVHRAGYRRGFPGNCNWGAEFTDAPLLCILNSDIEALPRWLTTMAETVLEAEDIGIVGARLLFPPTRGPRHGGRVQHAGVAFNINGEPYHPFRQFNALAREVMQRREINAVTGACMLIRRSLWDSLGGFDESFIGGQYEDIDFCHRTRQAGYKIVYEPKAVLYHYEHGSGEEHVMRSSVRNRKLLLERWPNVPCDEHLFGIGVKGDD